MSTYPTTTGEELAVQDLKGTDVCDASGETIGTVEGAFVDAASGTSARYLAIRTGWFGTKRHIVPLDDVRLDRDANVVRLPYDRDRLKEGPTVDHDSTDLSTRDEEDIYRYYGRPGYWEAVNAKQTTPSPTPEIAQADVAAAMAASERGTTSRGGSTDPDARRDVRDPSDPGRHGGMVAAGGEPTRDDRRVRWYDQP